MRALLLASLVALPAVADDTLDRDPTAWPPALRQSLAAARAASAASGPAEQGSPVRHVVITGGKAYVVVGTRRYGVGELLDGASIQRIEEQAVWLQEGGRVRREPLFAGVEKRPPFDAQTKKSKEKP